ncbi:MAG: hypothetical protein AB7V50_10560 [Vampirovibrionia bacterium]
MNTLEKDILNYIQTDFPLVKEPFRFLAQNFNSTESEVLATIDKLKNIDGVIRTISAIFNPVKLGYSSALIAVDILNSDLGNLVEFLNNHNGVSHNYLRDHKYNLWFTIALPEYIDIYSEILNISKVYNFVDFIVLPSIKTYKLKVDFKFGDNSNSVIHKSNNVHSDKVYQISDLDKLIIKELQNELPLISRPYKFLADNIFISEDELITKALYYKDNKIMRRYCATLRHVKAGFKSNAMVVWQVNLDNIDSIGNLVSETPFVSHCYQRVVSDKWYYNFYTMVHALSDDLLNQYIEQLQYIISPEKYEVLKTLNEFKKSRVKYF